jgi:hypothetical protein
MLLCFVLIEKKNSEEKPFCVIGFSAPKRRLPRAVDRNRIKRLMREVVRKKLYFLKEQFAQKKYSGEIILQFKGNRLQKIDELTMADFEKDWMMIEQEIEKMI